jgi:Flp pilus assembly protein TadD
VRALEELGRAVAMRPDFHHAWMQTGAIRLRQRRFEEAAEAFERARQAYPYAAEPYLGLARLAQARGDAAGARHVLEAGLQHLPGDPGLRAALAEIDSRRTIEGRNE